MFSLHFFAHQSTNLGAGTKTVSLHDCRSLIKFVDMTSLSVASACLVRDVLTSISVGPDYLPGNSAVDLFGMVKTGPFQGLLVTSNDRHELNHLVVMYIITIFKRVESPPR